MVLLAQQHEGSFSFPEQASTFAGGVDGMYAFIFWISLFFFLAVNILMFYFVWKYRRRGNRLPEKSPSHHMTMELAWTIIPSLIVLIIFVQGAFGYFSMRVPPESANAVERTIEVKAFKYGWQFIYPNGDITSELHLAKNVPVRFRISAKDALHSFYIREFRLKMDCVPGRYTEAWVKPTLTRTPSECISTDEDGNPIPGEKQPFHLACAEYCGEGHSQMRTEWQEDSKSWSFPVYVHDCSFDELAEFTNWKTNEHSAWENGQFYYNAYGCVGCHAIENQPQKIGPNFAASSYVVGGQRKSNAGEVIKFEKDVDIDNYLRRSINYSTEFVVEGYPNQMPKFEFDDQALDYLIAFIRNPESDPGPKKEETADPSAE